MSGVRSSKMQQNDAYGRLQSIGLLGPEDKIDGKKAVDFYKKNG